MSCTACILGVMYSTGIGDAVSTLAQIVIVCVVLCHKHDTIGPVEVLLSLVLDTEAGTF